MEPHLSIGVLDMKIVFLGKDADNIRVLLSLVQIDYDYLVLIP